LQEVREYRDLIVFDKGIEEGGTSVGEIYTSAVAFRHCPRRVFERGICRRLNGRYEINVFGMD
jgi:hypothetical protein